MRKLGWLLVVATVILSPALLAAGDIGDGTMLLEAAASGDAARVTELLSDGARVDVRDAAKRTSLLLATRGDHVDVARALIAAGADVNAKDNIRDTPFLYAGAEGRDAILRMILDTGRANVKDTNRYGGTALIPAAHHGHPGAVRILLGARQSMWLVWGPQQVFLYNDACRAVATVAERHPGALGRPAAEVWPDVWPAVQEQIAPVLATGRAGCDDELMLLMQRGDSKCSVSAKRSSTICST